MPDAGAVALVTIDNGEDHTRPTFFGRAALESLERLLPELEEGDWDALVLTGKPFVFAAGADVTQFPGATRELAVEGSRAGHELFGRIRELPYPTVAAVNGACLGGGVEIALHCDARTISTAVRHFACPECFLGIVPAWGGTQLVPRLVGVETAVKFIPYVVARRKVNPIADRSGTRKKVPVVATWRLGPATFCGNAWKL